MVYENFYKVSGIPTLSESLAKRNRDAAADRQAKQRELFWSRRVSSGAPLKNCETHVKAKRTRAEMLKKWKAEKLKKLEEIKKRQKPVFKVGVVQRTASGSPKLLKSNISISKSCLNSNISKKNFSQMSNITCIDSNERTIITRSMTKYMHPKEQENCDPIIKSNSKFTRFCKIDTDCAKAIHKHEFKVPQSVLNLPFGNGLTFPISPKITKKKNQEMNLLKNVGISSKESCVNVNKTKKVDSFQVSKKFLSKTTCENSIEAGQIYCKTQTMKTKVEEASLSSVNKANEQQTKEENNITPFRTYIKQKAKHLFESCEKWELLHVEAPPDIQGEIDSIIGKTKLLVSDKFKQFESLIEKFKEKDPLIQLDDLQGYQDWVSIEVESLLMSFKNLEECKKNNWASEKENYSNQKINKKLQKNKCSNKISGKSNIRAHIEAKRKIFKEAGSKFSSNNIILNPITILADKSLKVNTDAETDSNFINVKEQCNNAVHHEVLKSGKTKNISAIKKITPRTGSENGAVLFNNSFTLALSGKKEAFNSDKENTGKKSRGLKEKYFKPADEFDSPIRLVFGNLNNVEVTPSRMITRSKLKVASDNY